MCFLRQSVTRVSLAQDCVVVVVAADAALHLFSGFLWKECQRQVLTRIDGCRNQCVADTRSARSTAG